MRISDWSSDVCSSDLGEDRGRSRRFFRWFEDHRIAGGQRGRDLGENLVHRPVPRRDQRDDADGFVHHSVGADPLLEPEIPAPRSPPSDDRSRSRPARRSEEHTSELQSLMRISYAVFCLKKKKNKKHKQHIEKKSQEKEAQTSNIQ